MTLVSLPDGGWGRPVGGRVSTHILKAEDRRDPGLVTLERACLQLARHLDLTSVDAKVVTLGSIDCLLVDRFDREVVEDDSVRRVHQEDLCQALGYDPSGHRKGKYERFGAPGFLHAAELLRSWAAPAERERLLAAMVFTVVIGNADAHAKNLALLHVAPGQIQLAPLYDTVPTVLFPQLPRSLAMTVNARFEDIDEPTVHDLVTEAAGRRRWRLGEARARSLVIDTLERLRACAQVLDLPEELAERVAGRAAGLLEQMG